jgi:hypothetical protein
MVMVLMVMAMMIAIVAVIGNVIATAYRDGFIELRHLLMIH